MKKNSLLSLMMASAVLLSSCSSIIDSGYIGYKKNEMKYGKGVTKQFQQAVNNSRQHRTIPPINSRKSS